MSVSCGNWATGVCGGGFLDCGEPAPERVAGSWVLVMGDWGSVGVGVCRTVTLPHRVKP